MERFQAGNAFEFREVGFHITADGVVHCIIESSWQAENVTPATANDDLDEGEAAFKYLMQEASEFRAAVGDRPVSYELVEDYGMGSILICSRRDGVVEWAHGFPHSAG
jgi:hypothetical protein